MNKMICLFLLMISIITFSCFSTSAQMMITGVVDGPLSGGTPKAIEFFVTANIDNLSEYGFGVANNGGGSDGREFTFSGSASPGDFLYFVHENSGGVQAFNDFFGFGPDFSSNSFNLLFNGDDAIELYRNGNVLDRFGDPSHGGSPSWSYLDGWAYRDDFSAPSGNNFPSGDWDVDAGALSGATQNGNNGSTAFPIGTYNHGGPLAVTLQHFEAHFQNRIVNLDWKTSEEIDHAYFEIERKSSKGEIWKILDQVLEETYLQENTAIRKYTYSDHSPLFGENIYRLKIVDRNGGHTYSPMVSVSVSTTDMFVSPNPFSGTAKLNIHSSNHQAAHLQMFDIMGNLIYTSTFQHHQVSYDIPNAQRLAAGIYFLKVELDGTLYQLKLVKR